MPIRLSLIAIALLTASARAADPPPSYSQVHALLAKNCLNCHGAKDPEGNLVLESYDTLIKGGETGPAIVKGNAAESLLFKLIERKEKPFMPPPKKAAKLADAEIALIRAWIDAGAKPPGPGEVPVANATTRPVEIPHIAPKSPARTPIQALAVEATSGTIAIALPGIVELRTVDGTVLIRKLEGHHGNVNALAFSADGKQLAAGAGEIGVGGEIRVWDVANGKLLATLSGHKDAVYAVAISPDGKTLASGSYDQEILLWNIAEQKTIRTLHGHNGAICGLSFRKDGKVLASASADRTMKLWDPATGKRLDTRSEPLKEQNAVAFSPDGQRVAAAGVDNRIRIWKVTPTAAENTNPLLIAQFAHEGAILRLAWSGDGKSIVTSADDRTVKVWDVPDTGDELKQRATLPQQPDWPTGLAFAEKDQKVIVGRLDGTIAAFDAKTGNLLAAPKPAEAKAAAGAKPAKPGAKAMPADAGKPQVVFLDPPAIQRGKTATLKLTGQNLAGLTAVRTVDPKFKDRLTVSIEAGSTETSATFTVSAAPDVPLSPYELVLVAPAGESTPLKIWVDDLQQFGEVEPNETPSAAHEIELPGAAWGRFMARGDADCFAFDAAKSQTIVIDCAAQAIGSKAAVTLEVIDSTGRVLASANRFDNDADALLDFTAPADGRYVVRATEAIGAASNEHFYRLTIGSFPFVTGAFPLAVRANESSKVHLIGFNLPKDSTATVKAGAAGEIAVPLEKGYRSRRPINVMVAAAEQHAEAEPNDMPTQATQLAVPFGVSGTLAAPKNGIPDADLYRFTAKKGQTYALETAAQRRGSPADTKIEVLHADGKPVERVKLRAVRDSYITFRPIDANNAGARLQNWEEMQLNQFVYFNGEVVRLFRVPQGPDSEYLFYPAPGGGKRKTYFDTSATSHALDERAYIVEPHEPSAGFPANGLPTFALNYANDDAADRNLGSDSRLLFTAPADGEYLARVSDVRGFGGERFVYHLSVRPAHPDFRVDIDLGKDPAVPAGGGKSFTVKVDRIDGFDGPVRVEFAGVPEGFRISSPIVVAAGHLEAKGTLFAPAAEAGGPATKPSTQPAPPSLKATATAQFGNEQRSAPPIDLGTPKISGKPMIHVYLDPSHDAAAKASNPPQAQEIVVKPGQMATALLRIERGGFKERVSFDVENLPHGVIVADIGLSGVLIPEGQSERQIFISCAPWVADQTRVCHARAREAGNPTSAPIMLRIQK